MSYYRSIEGSIGPVMFLSSAGATPTSRRFVTRGKSKKAGEEGSVS